MAALTSDDVYYFSEGTHTRLADVLGAHLSNEGGQDGARCAVWAPNARSVSVIGDFNGWLREVNPLRSLGQSGLWEAFVPGLVQGGRYKYHIQSQFGNYQVDKADPVGFLQETPPGTASVVWDLRYE